MISVASPDPDHARTAARGFAVVAACTVGFGARALWRFRRPDVVLN